MKNKALKITATAIAIFCSLTGFAQQAVTPKAPEVSGPVLQTAAESKTPAPATETKLHETATKQSSFSGPVPVKANDKAEPAAKAPEQKPLPETDKLVPPNRAKNR